MYESARVKTNPYVVGVTGSVAKTTTIAFHEHLLREAGLPVVRFWSKRLTPLLVQTHYVNRVDEGTGFIVMEYSAYGHDHVAELARTLPPNIAFLTNIYDTHIGPGQFKDRRDICDSKLRIRPNSVTGYLNQMVLNDLGIEAPEGWSPFDVDQEFIANNPYLPPTLRTAEMQTTGRLLAKELRIPESVFINAFETFKPQERRIIAVTLKDGAKIFFDGDATYGSRQMSWFETVNGSTPVMMVEEVNFGDEDLDGQHDLVRKLFESDSTFVLDTEINRSRIPVDINPRYLSASDFRDRFNRNKGGYMVYHKALATRDNSFDPENYLNRKF